MIKLVNISTFDDDIKRFKDDEDIKNFFKEYRLDGFELIQFIKWNEKIIKKENIKGLHLRYYPTWLDFWNGNKKELIRQFKDEEGIKKYYGGLERNTIIDAYKEEIKTAIDMGVKYVVFHVGHAQNQHFFDYDFTYTDEEVIKASIELVNEIMEGINSEFELLFENLWWPGLTLRKSNLAAMLLEEVEYEHKGFMLDTGHLMNTNPYIKNEMEGINYVIDTVNNLGELKDYIKGIHMNCSISGSYVIEAIKKYRNLNRKLSLAEMNSMVFPHILKIDLHKPFENTYSREIVNIIEPDFLTYEFLTRNLQEMKDYIYKQNVALNL